MEPDPAAPPRPELTLPQYVSLGVELELYPARAQAIGERYGLLSEVARAALDREWSELEAYPDRRTEILGLYGIHTEAGWRSCEAHWTGHLVAQRAGARGARSP